MRRCAIFEIVATDRTTGKRVRLAMADSAQERDRMLSEERQDKANRRYKEIKAVRVWN